MIATTEELDKLYAALDEFHEKSNLVKATKENDFLKNKYAPYNVVVAQTKQHLVDAHLRVLQAITHIDGNTAIWTRLIHLDSKQYIESISPVVHKDNDPQGQGSGITYMKRYSYIAILGILVDQDDDANVAQGLVQAAKKTKGIEEAVKKIEEAKTLKELQSIFAKLGKLVVDPKVVEAKDKKKEELEHSQI